MRQHLIKIQSELGAISPLIGTLPSYWVQNATSEAMAKQFEINNNALFCFSPEAGEVVRVMFGKYQAQQKGDFDLYLSGYSVEPWKTDRINRGTLEIIPCLSMLLFCQPYIIQELLTNEEALERGLTARTLIFSVNSELREDDGVIRTINSATEEAWKALIENILSLRSKHGEMSEPKNIVCTQEGREVFRCFHNESIQLRKGEFQDIEGELGRWRENAIRLAFGQCIADSVKAEVLTKEQAMRGVAIARWCALSSLEILNRGRMERLLERVKKLQEIVRAENEKITLRDLNGRHGFSQKEVRHLAGEFSDKLQVISEKPQTGRPSEVLVIPEHLL